jgi:hypothetical protein
MLCPYGLIEVDFSCLHDSIGNTLMNESFEYPLDHQGISNYHNSQ